MVTVMLTRLVDLVKFRIWNVVLVVKLFCLVLAALMWRCCDGRSAAPVPPRLVLAELAGPARQTICWLAGRAGWIDAKGASLQLG